jgi:hypothetical protein
MPSLDERFGSHARHKRFSAVLDIAILLTLGIEVWRITNLAIGRVQTSKLCRYGARRGCPAVMLQ